MSRFFVRLTRLCVVLVATVTTMITAAKAAEEKVVFKFKENHVLSVNGDTAVDVTIRIPDEAYAKFKKTVPNAMLAVRKLGITNQESVISRLKAEWDDEDNALKITCTAHGASRLGRDGTWSIPLMEGVDSEVVSAKDGLVVLKQKMKIPGLGIATSTAKVTLPEGASVPKLSRDGQRLTYRMPEPKAGGSNGRAEFDVETKKTVMASLAKVLSNRKFTNLWTARGIFKNTGDQLLRDYRVRFRMSEFTPAWSPWAGTPVVIPGQTVVDSYFPVMDLEKVGKMTGQTKASVEIQWQYTRADGKTIDESETKELTILSRNQVQYGSMRFEESSDWNDLFDMSHIVMGCFVTHEDPVIQQAAGRICKAIGGNDASLSDEAALKYMQAVFEFMGANIAYQTSPGSIVDGKLIQHVKYGRDVLRNKAGTCIDLAILYGSLCEAVGLKPVLFNIPGHCFPGVYLPKSGKLVAVEATMIGGRPFADAVNHATEENMKPIIAGTKPTVIATIIPLHESGVHPIDLPVLADDVLDKWGITFGMRQTSRKNNDDNRPVVNNQPPLVGVWKTTYRRGGMTVVQTAAVTEDGNIASVAKTNTGFTYIREGTWTMKGNQLHVRLVDGTRNSFSITMDGNDRLLLAEGDGEVLDYRRIK